MKDNITYGTLCYNYEKMRLDIDFGNQNFYGGLHCGTPLKVFINNAWVDSSVEYCGDWYLTGINKNDFQYGLKIGIIDYR